MLHSQQFAEKALKAFLISRKIDFKRNHDIVYLLNLCSEFEWDFTKFKDMSKILSVYAVEIRYPDDYYVPSVEEAKCAFSHVEEFKNYIVKKLDFDEKQFYKPYRKK
ncbi:MAG: HEPN domain-containing protein [Caldisericia bacterium]|nr:HEPN domain-containing protein [Caldisericia bacterium]